MHMKIKNLRWEKKYSCEKSQVKSQVNHSDFTVHIFSGKLDLNASKCFLNQIKIKYAAGNCYSRGLPE